MTHHDQGPDGLSNDAASWYLRLQDPELSVEESLRFQAWRAVPENKAAFENVATAWEYSSQASFAMSTERTPARTVLHWCWRAAAASFLLMTLTSPFGTGAWVFESREAAANRALPDGGSAIVAAESRLEFSLDEHQRSAYLRRGQAFFRVIEDADRPFLVRTPVANVLAVGTRFAVSYRDQTSIITVTQGSVSVSRAGGSPACASKSSTDCWHLVAGERLLVSPTEATVAPYSSDDGSLDWARTLHVRDLSVAQAIERFNRLSDVRAELADPRAALVSITFSFQLDDPASFAMVVAERTSSKVILRARDAAGRPTTTIIEPRSK